jgi:3-hydroxyisobutyrate dehydrogenase
MASTTQDVPAKSYGFIGLGIMGYGMAKNLRAKLPAESVLTVCELNKLRRDEFVNSTSGKIEVAENPVEVVRKSVCLDPLYLSCFLSFFLSFLLLQICAFC